MFRNNALMLNLTAASLFSLMVLTGLYFYSGSSLPSTDGAGAGEALMMWLISGVLMAVPLLTSVLWILRLRQKKRAGAE